MKPFFFCVLVVSSTVLSIVSFGQSTSLKTGETINRKLLKGETHQYTITLKRGEQATCTVLQKGVDLAIDLLHPSGRKLLTFDSPNGTEGPEPVAIEAAQKGTYQLRIYPLIEQPGMSDSMKVSWAKENQGAYEITEVAILSARQYSQKKAQNASDKEAFTQWIATNALELKTVDAGAGVDDLQPLKAILKDVRVVGLGESSHGTSEFFRMKHRMLDFLVREMGYTSFYLEASMTRCRYINNYVLHGRGNLDTAMAIQGFVTWRVEEVRSMIAWMRQYNASVPDEKKVQFFGYDLQINDHGWQGLNTFYERVKPQQLPHLDGLRQGLDSAAKLSNSLDPKKQQEGPKLFTTLYRQCLDVLNDVALNEGAYCNIIGKDRYDEALMNIRLIVQEVESYKDGYNGKRDYYMAENILYLLNREAPDAKVVVWAHNGHISKGDYGSAQAMGHHLAKVLGEKYYAVGFEFYSGSFQTRNLDGNNTSKDWDVMSVKAPPAESLPWYFNQTGKEKFFIDFRATGADSLKNFTRPYDMHGFGSMYSTQWPALYPSLLRDFDGMIYIKESTAAKNFKKLYLH